MDKSFFVAGIGASAGGLPALIELFKNIPQNIPMAFVVVTHLIRNYKSQLNIILKKHTSLPVIRVEENMPIEPGNIYVLVENTFITVNSSCLNVITRNQEIINWSVNIFLKTLAADFRHKSIAIILSGGGRDGLEGTLDVKKAGGHVIVQDLDSAEVDGMPLSVIRYDHPNAVMSPAEIAEYLIKISHIDQKAFKS